MRLSLKAIREEIAETLASAEAFLTLAKAEERDLSDDEAKQFASLMDRLGNDGSDGNPKTGLRAEEDYAERYQLAVAGAGKKPPSNRVPTIATAIGGEDDGEPGDDVPRAAKIRIPAQARYRHGNLVSYLGDHAEERAYTAGQFLRATIFRDETAAVWCKDHGINTSFRGALKESDNSLGGFVVPDEMEQAIIDLREQYGVFRRESMVSPMMSDTKTVPRRTSGVTAYFGTEGASMTESDKGWDSVSLVAKKLYSLTRYSNELSEDAIISIGDDLTNEIAYAFALKEDQCGFVGDGTSTYGGITGVMNAMAAGSIYTAATGNTAFSTLDLADFEGVVGKLPQYAEMNAKWYVSKVGFWQSMARLANAVGGNTTDNTAAGPNVRQFLGYPVVISQVMNTTTTAQTSTNILAFGDLRMAATFGSRRGLSIALSNDAYFTSDQIAIRGTERFDINVHERGDATNAGAMIVLATPGS